MRALIHFSLRNTLTVILTAIFLLGWGGFVATQMNQEEMPAIDFPYIVVTTVYPGASPQDVADRVTRPLERAARGLAGVKNVYATSVANLSAITVEFNLNTDVKDDQRRVQDAVNGLSLPPDAGAPHVSYFGFSDAPVLEVSLVPQGQDVAAFQGWARDELLPQLRTQPGVGKVSVATDLNQQVLVVLDREKLVRAGLTASTVVQMLRANNLALPAGATQRDEVSLNVRVQGDLRTLDDLANLRLPVVPSQQEQFQQALQPLIDGIRAMGRSLGQMGQNLAQLGQGVSVVEAQVQLLNSKQNLTAALVQERAQLGATRDPQQRAALEQKIARETQALAQIDAQWQTLQDRMAALNQGTAPGSGPAPAGVGPGVAAPTSLPTVRLGDLGRIRLAAPDTQVVTRLNAQPALLVQVIKDPEANAAATAEAVLGQLQAMSRGGHPFRLAVISNAATSIRSSVAGMEREAGLGAVFAALIIYLFLRRWRATLVAVVSIPTSIAIGLIAVAHYGVTLNIMSLGGLAVAVGRVVDDAIVVTENIFRHARLRGYTTQVVLEASTEVASAITASTLTTVAVFAPLGLVGGIVGKVFQPFALTVVFSLLASLVVAITLVPALTFVLNRGASAVEVAAAEAPLTVRYRRVLTWFLDHKLLSSAVALALFATSLLVLGRLGTSFLPADATPTVSVRASYPEGTALERMDSASLGAERALLQRSDVLQVQATVAANSQLTGFGRQQPPNTVQLKVALKSGADANTAASAIQRQLQPLFPGATVRAAAFSAVVGGGNSIQMVFSGPDSRVLQDVAGRVEQHLAKLNGLANLSDSMRKQSDSVVVTVDQAKAAQLGLSVAQVLAAVHEALSGQDAGTFTVAGHAYPIKVTLGQAPDLTALRSLPLHGTQTVTLQDVAQVRVVAQPTSVNERNLQPYVMITADITSADVGAVTSAVARAVRAVALPPGVSAQDVGATQVMRDGFTQMGEAMVGAIFVVYLVMLVTFGEALAPLAILFSLPFAGVGAIFALWLSHYTFSIPAMIGLLMLIGIVVTNAIVLMDRFQQQRRLGLSVRAALLEAATTRLRPILMTALATMFALIPLAAGFSEGSLISATLAVVVIGGLFTSTLLTLVIVPMAYENLRWLARLLGRRIDRGARTGV